MSYLNLCKMLVLTLTVVLGACSPEHPGEHCIETGKVTVATYPNAGLLALGPEYTGMAMIPVYVEQEVCVKWGGNNANAERLTEGEPHTNTGRVK